MTPRRTAAAISATVAATAAAAAVTVASLLGGGGNVVLDPLDNWQVAFDAAPAGTTFECRGTHTDVSVQVTKQRMRVIGGEDCVLAGNGKPFAFHYSTGGELFTLQGPLTITGYQPPQQRGVIQADGPSAWTIDGVTMERNGGLRGAAPGPIGNAAYCVRVGNDMRISGSTFRHCGSLGIGGVGLRLLIVANTVELNNWADQGMTSADVEALAASLSGAGSANNLRQHEIVDGLNEGGGFKLVRSTGLIADNVVRHNAGPGIWTDIDNGGALGGLGIEDNLVEWNANDGIKHEISYAATIEGNTARYNGWAFYVWGWGAQIMVQNSSGVVVRNNEVRVPASGKGNALTVINQNRGSGSQGPWVSLDVVVEDNLIVLEGTRGNIGIFDDTPTRASAQEGAQTWQRNTYVGANVATASHWERIGRRTFSQWQALGYGQGSETRADFPPDPAPTPSTTGTATASPTTNPPTPSPTSTPSPTPTPTPSPSPTSTPSATPSPSPTASATPTPSPTAAPSPTASPTPGPTPDIDELIQALLDWLRTGEALLEVVGQFESEAREIRQ